MEIGKDSTNAVICLNLLFSRFTKILRKISDSQANHARNREIADKRNEIKRLKLQALVQGIKELQNDIEELKKNQELKGLELELNRRIQHNIGKRKAVELAAKQEKLFERKDEELNSSLKLLQQKLDRSHSQLVNKETRLMTLSEYNKQLTQKIRTISRSLSRDKQRNSKSTIAKSASLIPRDISVQVNQVRTLLKELKRVPIAPVMRKHREAESIATELKTVNPEMQLFV